MLTQKQFDLLMLIHKRLSLQGVPPSYEEMKHAIGLRSKSGIHQLITTLEQRGFIRRMPNKARSLEILRLPPSIPSQIKGQGFTPSIIEGRAEDTSSVNQNDGPFINDSALLSVPIIGRMVGGVSVETPKNQETELVLPDTLLGKGDFFGLVVQGVSMADAGINDGDYAIMRKSKTANNGEIIAVLIDREEVMLRYYRRHGETAVLEAANSDFPTRIVAAQQLTIQGQLAMIIRRY